MSQRELDQWHRSALKLVEDLVSASDPRKLWAVAWLVVRAQPLPHANALLELISSGLPPTHDVWATTLILRLTADAERIGIDAGQVSFAVERMKLFLAGESAEKLDTAARALLNIPLDVRLLPDIRKLLRRTKRSGSACAAIILFRAGYSSQGVLLALQRGCGSPLDDIGHPAARALAEAGRDDPVAQRMYLNLLKGQSNLAVRRAAAYVALPGLPRRECAALLARQLHPPCRDMETAAVCALHLSKLEHIAMPFADSLLPLLASDDPHAVEGATVSIGRLRHRIPDATELLVSRLKSAPTDIREAILNGLCEFPLTPQLLDRAVEAVGFDGSDDEIQALGGLIGKSGSAAINLIQGLVPDDDSSLVKYKNVASQCAVISVASRHLPQELIERLLIGTITQPNDLLLATILSSALYLRRDSNGLVPALVRCLEETSIDQLAIMILSTIHSIGPLPPSGYDAVVRCLLIGEGHLRELASATLVSAGPELDAYLLSIHDFLADEARSRVDEVLARRGSMGNTGSSRMQRFGNDLVLQRVVLIVHSLLKLGKVSMRVVAQHLEQRKQNGEVDKSIVCSETSLRDSVRLVHEHFDKVEIINSSKGKKGKLGSSAVEFYDEARFYLSSKKLDPIPRDIS